MNRHVIAAVGLALLAGCKPDDESSRNSAVPEPQSKPELVAILTQYERIRSILAEDRTEGLADAAGALATAAEQAELGASEAARPNLRAIVASASKLKEEGAMDLAKARRAFGDLSQRVIGLAAEESSLAQGRHVFLCPMTKETYNKWVQTSPDVSNPYMGKKMPG